MTNFLDPNTISSEPVLNDLQKLIKSEIIFKQTSQRDKFLNEFTFNLLSQVKATSVDVEGVFSSLGLIITKFRSRLADLTIDNYLFLKHFFFVM